MSPVHHTQQLFDFDLLEAEGEGVTKEEEDKLNNMVVGFKTAAVLCDTVAVVLTGGPQRWVVLGTSKTYRSFVVSCVFCFKNPCREFGR